MSVPRTDLVKKIQQMFGAKVEAWSDQEEIDPDKPILQPNRRDQRRAKQHGARGGTGAVHDALRLGPRAGRVKRATGQPLWFRQMKYNEARRKSLEKVTMDRLEPAVGQIALDLYAAGYKTVWDVTEVEEINEFLRHGQHDKPEIGISVNGLRKLRTYLTQQRVPVKWSA